MLSEGVGFSDRKQQFLVYIKLNPETHKLSHS